MINPNSEQPPRDPELITEIPANIRNAIGDRAYTGPKFEFLPAGTQEYAHARTTDRDGNTTSVTVREHLGDGTTIERELRGRDLDVFLASNPEIAER